MYMHKLEAQATLTCEDNIVTTKQGKVRGLTVDGTHIFRGVPYAVAKRFREPEEVPAWEGVKPCLSYGKVCFELNTPMPADSYTVPHFFWPQGENCQWLNIWTQGFEGKRPVMVWLHGGGWFSGSAVELYAYDGENLSKHSDVVVVSVTHRLNVLGFLDVSEMGEEFKNSANCGLADLVAALKWIKENIAQFGGDPDNVTIMGQSGGGDKVGTLLQTPAADGLFHKAVMESGGFSNRNDATKEDDQFFTRLILKELGATKDSDLLDCDWYDLAEATAVAMTTYQKYTGKRKQWGPQANGYFVGHGASVPFRKETANIPLLAGTCFSEFSGNQGESADEPNKNTWDKETLAIKANEAFGDKANEVLKLFSKAYPEKNVADAVYLEIGMRKDCMAFCEKRAKECGAPVYNWMFNLESPFNGGTTAWHNAEEPYVFRNAAYIESEYIPEVSEKLENEFSDAWASFAKTGNPNHELIPEWKAVEEGNVPIMIFDRETRAAENHDRELMEMIPQRQKKLPMAGNMLAVFGK